MKKLTSLLLALLLACTLMAVPMTASADELTIDPLLLTIFEMTPSQYVADEVSRSVFATMAMLDAILTDNASASDISSEAIINDTIYVAYSDGLAVCFLFGDNTCLMIGFGGTTASGTFIDLPGSLASSLLAELKSGGSLTSYWKVPSSEVMEWMQVVLDALED